MNENENGVASLSLLITVGILSVIVLSMASSSLYLKKLRIKTRDLADLNDLKHFISENISCDQTVSSSDFECGLPYPTEISLYDKFGNILVDIDGMSKFHKAFIQSDCSHDEINVYYRYDESIDSPGAHLFDEIPIRCPTEKYFALRFLMLYTLGVPGGAYMNNQNWLLPVVEAVNQNLIPLLEPLKASNGGPYLDFDVGCCGGETSLHAYEVPVVIDMIVKYSGELNLTPLLEILNTWNYSNTALVNYLHSLPSGSGFSTTQNIQADCINPPQRQTWIHLGEAGWKNNNCFYILGNELDFAYYGLRP